MDKIILVIEDDNDIIDVIKTVLNSNKFAVIGYRRADNILELINEHNPDLVLTDYMLPGLTGGRICQLIKENDSTRNLPVILMSAYNKVAISVLNFKYDAYISKPFDINKLLKIIQKLTAQKFTKG